MRQWDTDPRYPASPSHQGLPLSAMGANARPVEMVGSQVGSLMAQDLVDDRLRLIEQPDGQGNPVFAKVRAAYGPGHPVAEPHFDLRSKFVQLPHAQTVFELDSKRFGMLLWDIGLSGGTCCHRRSIAMSPKRDVQSSQGATVSP